MVIGIVLLAVAAIEVVVGLWLIFGYRRSAPTLWYGFLALGIALYVAANGFGFTGILSGHLSEHLAWTGGAFATIFILPFSFTYPIIRKSNRELLPLVLWPLAIFPLAILFTRLIIDQQSIVQFGKGYATSTGPYFWTFIVFFAIYWIWAVANLVRSFAGSDGQHRTYLKAILSGLVISLVISSTFDIVIPLLGATPFGYVGPLCSAVWLGFTSFILVKK